MYLTNRSTIKIYSSKTGVWTDCVQFAFSLSALSTPLAIKITRAPSNNPTPVGHHYTFKIYEFRNINTKSKYKAHKIYNIFVRTVRVISTKIVKNLSFKSHS